MQQSDKRQRHRQILGHRVRQTGARARMENRMEEETTTVFISVDRLLISATCWQQAWPLEQRLGGFTEHFVSTDLRFVHSRRLLKETWRSRSQSRADTHSWTSDRCTNTSTEAQRKASLCLPLWVFQGFLSEGSTCCSSVSSCPFSWPSWRSWSRSCWPLETSNNVTHVRWNHLQTAWELCPIHNVWTLLKLPSRSSVWVWRALRHVFLTLCGSGTRSSSP